MNVAHILVIAATPRELAPAAGWRTLCCGVGPVEAGVTTAAALTAGERPRGILHIGIAGARRAAALPPATVVLGEVARYTDLVIPAEWGTSEITPSRGLLEGARRVLPEARTLPIATTARVGGSRGCEVEGMEGFAVLRAAARAGIPALEVRVISNDIEEDDRSKWHFDTAFATLHRITPSLVEAIAQCVS